MLCNDGTMSDWIPSAIIGYLAILSKKVLQNFGSNLHQNGSYFYVSSTDDRSVLSDKFDQLDRIWLTKHRLVP